MDWIYFYILQSVMLRCRATSWPFMTSGYKKFKLKCYMQAFKWYCSIHWGKILKETRGYLTTGKLFRVMNQSVILFAGRIKMWSTIRHKIKCCCLRLRIPPWSCGTVWRNQQPIIHQKHRTVLLKMKYDHPSKFMYIVRCINTETLILLIYASCHTYCDGVLYWNIYRLMNYTVNVCNTN